MANTGITSSPPPGPATGITTPVSSTLTLPPELDQLPADVKSSMFSMMMSLIIRNTTGPDPETSRIVAQSEMHEESCRLDGYKESLHTKDKQNDRDHEFRKKQLKHETAKSMTVALVCIAGIVTGLYLIVAKNDSSVGTPLLVASFMALIGGKSLLPKDKD